MNDFVIQTDSLCLNYKRKPALKQLSLQVARGGIHAIVGANGAGKSSLFRVLLGFEIPSSGSAIVLDDDCGHLTPQQRARIGFVNEEHTLPLWLRVSELAAMQRAHYPNWSAERYQKVVRNFNVQPDQKISELSRGERAGVNLALVLAQRPELLILDEPTLGLDVVSKRAFLSALMASQSDDDSTIVYCSHQMEEIERIADSLIILERGSLLHASTPDAFCERIQVWVAHFPGRQPDLNALPGLLEWEVIEGLTHLTVFDQGEAFGTQLQLLGARNAQSMPASFDRAVNGLLARDHISNSPLAPAA
jgi:ABC-2 type transport system ATP-binding protein